MVLGGESAAYWKKENATLTECKEIRMAEGRKAAEVLGVDELVFYDFDDFPLEMNKERQERLARDIRLFRPDFIVTHDKGIDAGNMDHTRTSQAVMAAYTIASAWGAELDGAAVAPRQTPMFGFEPMFPEACGFIPDIYIDITDQFDLKMEAMNCLYTQKKSIESYVEKAKLRGNHCSTRGGRPNCKYAEAFTMYGPVYAYDAFVW